MNSNSLDSEDEENTTGSLDDLLSALDDQADQSSDPPAQDPLESTDFEWVSDQLQVDTAEPDPLEAAYAANHVLLLAPLRQPTVDQVCLDLCTPEPVTEIDVLFVSLTQTSEELIDHWQRHEPVLPANLGLLCAGDQSRATESVSTVTGQASLNQITFKSTPDPSDLTRLGIAITNLLSEWEHTGNQAVLCVHSITALLQYTDPQRLFRFFHLLQAKINRVDGIGHYHMDPSAHDKETIGIFTSLFDTVVRVREDGSIDVDAIE